ncbi:hypothetical protein [Nonomuraea sp. SYSU D8015]|uniref:hypothetical protein n=1 Tax=Nonomuraea sp. SYSU D8015 TaxID=2593644 RepID=UPI0016610DE1|nr:hypothetical protein [Nonomuraea sp. SYSU D8015]
MRKVLVAILAGGALVATGTPALAQPALGPYGYGVIKLGMSLKKARGTGKIVRKGVGGPCSGWDLKQYPTGRGSVGLYISKKRGVAVIFAQKGMKTPEGVGLGSTMKQVRRAYPRLKTHPSEFPYVSVPRNPKAYYAFITEKGAVRQLVLALDTQDCVN